MNLFTYNTYHLEDHVQWFSQWPLHLIGPYLQVNFPVSHSGILGIKKPANNAHPLFHCLFSVQLSPRELYVSLELTVCTC